MFIMLKVLDSWQEAMLQRPKTGVIRSPTKYTTLELPDVFFTVCLITQCFGSFEMILCLFAQQCLVTLEKLQKSSMLYRRLRPRPCAFCTTILPLKKPFVQSLFFLPLYILWKPLLCFVPQTKYPIIDNEQRGKTWENGKVFENFLII